MKCEKREVEVDGQKFVILVLTPEESEENLNDDAVLAAMEEAGLRPVTQTELFKFMRALRRPAKPTAAFGNTARGSSEAGFVGVPYLNTDGDIEVVENWTRGNTGDQWGGHWQFVFTMEEKAPARTS